MGLPVKNKTLTGICNDFVHAIVATLGFCAHYPCVGVKLHLSGTVHR